MQKIINPAVVLLYNWVFPLCIFAGCLWFFAIFAWLTQIEQQPNRWFEEDEAMAIWSVPIFFLCITGLIFSYRNRRKILTVIYGLFTFFAFGFVVLMAALSGINAGKT